MLGIDTIVIDLEDANKIIDMIKYDRAYDKNFYKGLAEKGLLEAFNKFSDEVRKLEDMQNRIFNVDIDDD